MQIVGVSFDEPEALEAWAAEEGFTFELWNDTDHTLAVYYGAAKNRSASVPDRDTRILDKNGVLTVVYDGVDWGTSPQVVLEDCQAIFGEE